MEGTLLVIATPLGHLDDLAPRARDALRDANLIACEDTRRTAILLRRYDIQTATVSCHEFNEKSRLDSLLARLEEGQTIALVSDAGTPGISDPGALLVRAACEQGHRVSPVPGPSALTALLSVSGMPADRFVFDGFLPHRGGERRRRLRELGDERRPVVVFETPHRIRDALRDIGEVLGPRRLVLGRELTKVHESILRGTPDELLAALGETPKGEIVMAIAPAEDPASTDRNAEKVCTVWREALAQAGGDHRAALKSAARSLGLKRAELQRLLAELGALP